MKALRTEIFGLVAALVLLSSLAIVSSAHAHPGPKGAIGGAGFGMPGMALMRERVADRLGLDDTQRQSVENIIEAAKPEFKALRESARANREVLSSLDPADAGYSNALNTAAAENGRLATEATLLAARVRNEIRAVLTEEQLAEFERAKERIRFDARRRGGRD